MPIAPPIGKTPLRRRRVVKVGVALATAGLFVILSACSSSGSSTASANGSTLTIVEPDNNMGWAVDYAFSGLEQSINTQATLLKKPYVKTSQTGVETQNSSVFDPYLAKSVSVSGNGLVYTFHLSNAVSAHGNKLTAEDVLWSFQRKYFTPTSISYGAGSPVLYNPDKQIKIVDTHTVSFTLTNAGYGAQLKALLSDLIGEVYDATWLKQHATKSDPYAVKWSSTHPNYGFGPYEVTTWNPSSGATLVARDNFVLGKPKVKTIIVRIVPDSGARVTAVESGTADIAENVDPAASAQAESNPNVIVPKVADSNQYIELPLVTNKAPFNNALVREAMAYAVPYDQIIKNVFHGLAVRNGSGFLDRKAPGYDGTGLPDYTFDVAKAKALLKQAGVTTPVKFALTVSASDSDMVNSAIQIQSAASAAGFDITINKVNQSQFNLQRSDHSSQAFILRDYAITMVPGYELTVYTAPGSGNNFADWENKDFYAAVAKGYEVPDAFSAAAGKAWNAAERIYIKQSPIVFIGQTQPAVLLNKKVSGYASRSDQWLDYYNLSISK
ncbi:MAG: peptide transporter substrate-binding protein [Frondihabitans sp.]|nr:peptide transporter substrate-binding protein [Frondihabitans sp.]